MKTCNTSWKPWENTSEPCSFQGEEAFCEAGAYGYLWTIGFQWRWRLISSQHNWTFPPKNLDELALGLPPRWAGLRRVPSVAEIQGGLAVTFWSHWYQHSRPGRYFSRKLLQSMWILSKCQRDRMHIVGSCLDESVWTSGIFLAIWLEYKRLILGSFWQLKCDIFGMRHTPVLNLRTCGNGSTQIKVVP